MKLTVARAKLLVLEEQAVIHQRQGIINIELILLAVYQGIRYQRIESNLECIFVYGVSKANLGGVVKQVGCFDICVFWVVDDRRLEAIKRYKVGYLLMVILESELTCELGNTGRTRAFYLHHVGPDNLFLEGIFLVVQQPVLYLVLVKRCSHVIFSKVSCKKVLYSWNILLLHLSQTSRRSSFRHSILPYLKLRFAVMR